MRYTFEWSPGKASANLRKHRVSFDQGAEVFRDPQAVSLADEEHSDHEERWVTVGSERDGRVLVVVHTFTNVSAEESKIRIISVRRAARREARQYRENKP